VHEIGLPDWGWQGTANGDVVNNLSALVADPNVTIQKAKSLPGIQGGQERGCVMTKGMFVDTPISPAARRARWHARNGTASPRAEPLSK